MPTPQERLREVVAQAHALSAKGVLDKTEAETFEALVAEAGELKGQIENLTKFRALDDFAKTSNGVPAMAPAGETIIETSQDAHGNIKAVIEQFGPGVVSNKAFMATTTKDYREAFKAYLRYGDRGLTNAQIKTLQEGQDQEGGFLVPSDVLNAIIAKEPTPTRIAGMVKTFNTSRDTLVVPRVNYTADDINVGVAA